MKKTTIYRRPMGENLYEEELTFTVSRPPCIFGRARFLRRIPKYGEGVFNTAASLTKCLVDNR